MVDTVTHATRFTPLTAHLGQRRAVSVVFPDTCPQPLQPIDMIEGGGHLTRQRFDVHPPSLRDNMRRMSDQRRLVARPRNGSGVMYGASVSMSSCPSGAKAAAARSSSLRLNVTLPAKDST